MSGPGRDPFAEPDWISYAERVKTELVPMIKGSALTVSLVPSGETDIKFAVELGLSIMMDKPIIVVVFPGSHVPEHLARVADAIVEGDPSSSDTARRLREAVAGLLR